jgi:predicted lipoprotein with Yx(FWY)xxD motif
MHSGIGAVMARAAAATMLMIVASACGGSGSSTSTASTPAPSPTAAPNVLAKAETIAGQSMTILVDSRGMTLYRWTTDTGANKGKINCVAGCAAVWPPFVLPAATTNAVPGTGVTGTITTLVNPEGKGTQVLYNGWPLYFYAKDQAPGDTTGQGVGGKWFVVTPDQAPNV